MKESAELVMKTWWINLSAREKQLVMGGGICLVIFLIYALIWSPLVDHVTSARLRVKQEQKLLQFMQSADKTISHISQQAQKKNGPSSPIELLSLLQKEINEAGLAKNLTQLKQGANDAVEMHFQKVEFDKLMSLLIAIVKQQTIDVTQMSAAGSDAVGVVNADVVLRLM